MRNQVRVLERAAKSRCFVIAEAGVNHNGDVAVAKRLVEVAAEAGADAVKFQLFDAKEQVSVHAKTAPYQRLATEREGMLDMAADYDMPWVQHYRVAEHAKKWGICYFASCFCPAAVQFLVNNIGADYIKIPSGELNNISLLQAAGQMERAIILSTGMATLEEIRDAIKYLKASGGNDLTLLHCVSSYPVPKSLANLRTIRTLMKEFDLPVGYSDHTTGILAPTVAVSLGAVMVEKHYTLDKTMVGPDHGMSLEPGQLRQMIMDIRSVEEMMGSGEKSLGGEEVEMRLYARRGLVAVSDLKAGAKLAEKDLAAKRPAIGIDPKKIDEVVGRKLRVDVVADMPITQEMIE